tara:strand:+ start:2326 stop:2583 length:258 start_codon:yes stop_codon:yes gene_type:complete
MRATTFTAAGRCHSIKCCAKKCLYHIVEWFKDFPENLHAAVFNNLEDEGANVRIMAAIIVMLIITAIGGCMYVASMAGPHPVHNL